MIYKLIAMADDGSTVLADTDATAIVESAKAFRAAVENKFDELVGELDVPHEEADLDALREKAFEELTADYTRAEIETETHDRALAAVDELDAALAAQSFEMVVHPLVGDGKLHTIVGDLRRYDDDPANHEMDGKIRRAGFDADCEFSASFAYVEPERLAEFITVMTELVAPFPIVFIEAS